MVRAVLRCWLIALALVLPGQALAQLAHTLQAANVRAGPSAVFPLVTWLPAKEPVRVVGCTEGSQWCDVVAGRTRGWVHSRYLSDRARNRAVPIIAFDVTAYWEAHYRRRHWAADPAPWADWNKPGFVPPPAVDRRASSRPAARTP